VFVSISNVGTLPYFQRTYYISLYYGGVLTSGGETWCYLYVL